MGEKARAPIHIDACYTAATELRVTEGVKLYHTTPRETTWGLANHKSRRPILCNCMQRQAVAYVTLCQLCKFC